MGTTEPAQPGWPSQPTWPALPAYQPAASPPWQPPLPQQGWNGPSIVGFILSVYPVVPLVGSVVAVVLGFVGNAQAKRQHERGSGLAKWAIGLGTFGVVATVAVVVALLISAAGVVQAIVNNSDARQDLDNSVVAAKTYYAVEGTYAGLTPQRMAYPRPQPHVHRRWRGARAATGPRGPPPSQWSWPATASWWRSRPTPVGWAAVVTTSWTWPTCVPPSSAPGPAAARSALPATGKHRDPRSHGAAAGQWPAEATWFRTRPASPGATRSVPECGGRPSRLGAAPG